MDTPTPDFTHNGSTARLEADFPLTSQAIEHSVEAILYVIRRILERYHVDIEVVLPADFEDEVRLFGQAGEVVGLTLAFEYLHNSIAEGLPSEPGDSVDVELGYLRAMTDLHGDLDELRVGSVKLLGKHAAKVVADER
jgi:hypothetical protein